MADQMTTSVTDQTSAPALEELITHFAAKVDVSDVLNFEFSESTQQRIQALEAQQLDADLTPAETQELAQMRYACGMVAVIKAQALARYAAYLKDNAGTAQGNPHSDD